MKHILTYNIYLLREFLLFNKKEISSHEIVFKCDCKLNFFRFKILLNNLYLWELLRTFLQHILSI